jgi:demethylmenaquinone methyltransferase/2-methoxy-6-polyprenyl-1,4-benzoquinol methylase
MESKAAHVCTLFSSVADRYDLLNSVLSLGRDKYWREFAASCAGLKSGGIAVDEAFDSATVGFGLRNVTDIEKTLREMTRVVKEGGRWFVLILPRQTSGIVRKSETFPGTKYKFPPES